MFMVLNFLNEIKRLFNYDVREPDKVMDFIERARKDGKSKVDVVVQYGKVSLHRDVSVYKIGVYLESDRKSSMKLDEITVSWKEEEKTMANVLKRAGYIRKKMVEMGLDSELINRRYKNM